MDKGFRKVVDANKRLSVVDSNGFTMVRVHPQASYARTHELADQIVRSLSDGVNAH